MRHIAIDGCIGSGKTTLARALARELGADLLEEAAHLHPFLAQFYSNPKKFALETELNFLLIHYHQLAHYQGEIVVSDFTFAKDLIFARMNLEGRDLECFEALYFDLLERLPGVPEVVLLDAPPEVCLQRVEARGDPAADKLTTAYLAELRRAYLSAEDVFGHPVVRINADAGATAERVFQLALAAVAQPPRVASQLAPAPSSSAPRDR